RVRAAITGRQSRERRLTRRHSRSRINSRANSASGRRRCHRLSTSIDGRKSHARRTIRGSDERRCPGGGGSLVVLIITTEIWSLRYFQVCWLIYVLVAIGVLFVAACTAAAVGALWAVVVLAVLAVSSRVVGIRLCGG